MNLRPQRHASPPIRAGVDVPPAPRAPRLFRSRLVGYVLALALLGALFLAVHAQYQYQRGRRAPDPRGGAPDWQIEPQFKHDVFTFVRIEYDSYGRRGWRGGGSWAVDYPDADLNLSYRLQQLTSMKVDPQGKVLRLTDPELFHHPFIYIVEPGGLVFSEDEVQALRRYLQVGGFLMVDDFWGEAEWANFYREIKRVLPDREPVDLKLDHPIFNCVFRLTEKPQIPNVGLGTQSKLPGPMYGITWERPDAREPNYRAFVDDRNRIMVMICHNTDLGDGWEREGENEIYFREFSEKYAYPLGINIIFYALTH
jgi:hypothetical protein